MVFHHKCGDHVEKVRDPQYYLCTVLPLHNHCTHTIHSSPYTQLTQGQTVLTLYGEHKDLLESAVGRARAAIGLSPTAPPARELVSHIVTKDDVLPWAKYSTE
jgi:hypothetical protein